MCLAESCTALFLASASDAIIIGFQVRPSINARNLAEKEGIAENGYRLLINCGAHGNQEVFHLHMHLVGGKPLGRMLPRNIREE